MRLVFNPTGKDINLILDGEKVLIPKKKSAVLRDSIGAQLQDLLPGLEYSRLSEIEAKKMKAELEPKPEPKEEPKVPPKPKATKKVAKPAKKKAKK